MHGLFLVHAIPLVSHVSEGRSGAQRNRFGAAGNPALSVWRDGSAAGRLSRRLAHRTDWLTAIGFDQHGHLWTTVGGHSGRKQYLHRHTAGGSVFVLDRVFLFLS